MDHQIIFCMPSISPPIATVARSHHIFAPTTAAMRAPLAYNFGWRSQQLGKNLVLHNTVAVFSSYYIYLLQSFLLPILRYYLDVFTCTPLHNYNNPKKLFDIATRHLLVKWRSCMTTIRPLKKFKSICVIYTAACWSNGPNQKVDISQLMC